MKAAGETAFVGCCCQPFFAKHAEDFERAGIPGILLDIDNTTCYDLGQARRRLRRAVRQADGSGRGSARPRAECARAGLSASRVWAA